MNREHWKQLLPVIQAFAEGKPVQWKIGGEWEDHENMEFTDCPEDYRIKPEPKLRPWKEGEIPLCAVWRHRSTPSVIRFPLLSSTDGVYFMHDNWATFERLFLDYEYSLDNGKKWLPCGVLEGGERVGLN